MSEFHRLIEQQIPRLRRYARALTRNRERADDLVQDSRTRWPGSDQGTILTPTGRAANTGRINNPWLPGAAMARRSGKSLRQPTLREASAPER
jgi:hypothetical protein